MEEPFITILQKKNTTKTHALVEAQPQEPPKVHTNVNWERKMAYADFRRTFNRIVNTVISSHNEADFMKVSSFIESENQIDHFPPALPTCLLVNKSDFANTQDQIQSLYEYMHKRYTVVKLDGAFCDSLKKCVVLINNSVSPAKTTIRRRVTRKDKAKGDDDPAYIEEPEDDTWFEAKTHLHVLKAMQVKNPIVVLIGNVMSMPRVVLNDLLYVLTTNRSERKIKFNLILGVGGSLDTFHTLVDLPLATCLSVKVVILPSVRDSILAIIQNYILNDQVLIQVDSLYICWIYQQVLMYNLSINSFRKTFLYMGFAHLYSNPLFFLCRYNEDSNERLAYYEKMLAKIPKDQREHLEKELFLGCKMTAKGLDDVYETHETERKKFQRLFELVTKVVLAAYPVTNKAIFNAKLMQKLMALKDVDEKTKAIMKYLKTVLSYKEFATQTLPKLLTTEDKAYEIELSMLEAQCASKPTALGSVMKDGFTKLPVSRLNKLYSQPKTRGQGKDIVKNEMNYRNDLALWIKTLVSQAFSEPKKPVEYCYYVKNPTLIKRVNPDIQGTLITNIMSENEDYTNLATKPGSKCKGAPSAKDLRLVLDITKGLGKDVNIDELMRIFEAECAKHPEETTDTRDRCIVSLLHLKNSGLFAQSGRSTNVWRKTFFGKASYHSKCY